MNNMLLSGNALPGYRINEYLMILSPHEALGDKMQNVKQQFYDAYKAPSALYGKPHLTLANFLQYGMREERLVNRLNTICMGYHPMLIELKDYGSFPTHTIFINVVSQTPIKTLVKKISKEAGHLMKLNNENRPHFIDTPHITIARKLQPWQYEKAWIEYSHKKFTGRFIADAILLLRRPIGEMKYQIVKRFEFLNLPGMDTIQGGLFDDL